MASVKRGQSFFASGSHRFSAKAESLGKAIYSTCRPYFISSVQRFPCPPRIKLHSLSLKSLKISRVYTSFTVETPSLPGSFGSSRCLLSRYVPVWLGETTTCKLAATASLIYLTFLHTAVIGRKSGLTDKTSSQAIIILLCSSAICTA